MSRLYLLPLAGLIVACSSSGSVIDDLAVGESPPDRGAPDRAVDLGTDQPITPDLGRDGRVDGPLPDAAQPPAFVELRGLMHMHSIYSHDACDGEGFVAGQPNTACLKQLRDAACSNKLSFVALTDHPSNMSSYTMQEDLLYDASAGDQLVLVQGQPIANRVTCSNGHQVLFSVGFESQHMMPLGLQAQPATKSLYSGISDASDPAQVKQQVQGLKGLGAVVAMVHSEEPDISAATIDSAGFEAMEWYNIHANFSTLIGDDLLSADPQNIAQLTTLVNKLVGLAAFMDTGSNSPHPDLVYLLFLDKMPQEGFAKWRAVQQSRPITGILGSDIHRNVSVESSMCAGAMQLVCIGALALVESALGVKLPAALKSALLAGGTIDLADGDRVDSYARLMRWLENRVLVQQAGDQLELLDALRAGRSYGVLTLFGDPQGFSFTAQQGSTTLQMGGAAKGPLALTLQLPAHPVPMGLGGVTFSAADALKAELRAKLVRVDAAGSTTIQQELTEGATVTRTVSQPGAYYVELWIKPKHLSAALGSESALAQQEYLWLISNPIRLVP